jgi:isoleucyl-tRNA synthetase
MDQSPMVPDNFDLKKSVSLPRTDFPMKANLPESEPRTLARWQEMDLYGRIRTQRAGSPMYVLHDGPPYANGNIHLGHAFDKILKDFIVKTKTMAGFDSPYIPGWDCHGLPIEIKVDSELGTRKASMSAAQIRGECRKYAEKYVKLQTIDFKRLGVFGRWDNPYVTMSPDFEAVIAGAFVDFLEKGYVYKGLKPVNWCIHCRTALAEAEVEYQNHTSPSIWVRFALTSDQAKIDPVLAGKRVYGLIWTTTPWTIPANVAIAFHPTFIYVAVETGPDTYIVAEELLEATAGAAGWPQYQIVAKFPGARMEGSIFRHPFIERDSVGVLADYVTLEAGTGAVHTAPGHGQEDFLTGQKYGLPPYNPVDSHGRFFHAEDAAGRLPEELIGKNVWQGNPIVIDLLKQHGALLAQRDLEHSYPHCWRCHHPTIFRATEQWFIGMERNGLRAAASEATRNVKWVPAWGEERMLGMVKTRPDWCISRQRVWGVPITVFYCEKCNEAMTEPAILRRAVDKFRTHSSDAWYTMTVEELIGNDVRCARCGASEFRKENDILDVWFESGSSHLAVLTPQNGLPWPSDMYLEGGDQYRGWFQSSLLVGVGLRGSAPYRECLTHGFTQDADGRAMSKSLGNVIEPEKIIKQYGAEVIRLWVTSVEFSDDVRLSPVILKRLAEAYRKFRNTFRYALGNLDDFDPAKHTVAGDGLVEIDQWILARTEDLMRKCLDWYREYAFQKVYRAAYDFATIDLSSVYFDVLKDRLYTSAPNSKARRSAQTALYRINDALVRLLAPLMAFTTEEVWQYMKHPEDTPDSVHLTLFPQPEELTAGIPASARERLANWDKLLPIREQVLKSLETARNEKFIGASLEAKVHVDAGGDTYPLLDEYEAELPSLFIVSQVSIGNGAGGIGVRVEKADGTKCERCWKYRTDVGSDPDFPTACAACAAAVLEMLNEA